MTAHHLSSVVAKGSESDRKFDGRFQRDEKGQTDVFWSILKWVVSDVPRSIWVNRIYYTIRLLHVCIPEMYDLEWGEGHGILYCNFFCC